MSMLSPARRSLRHRVDAELNLIPMIDILSVLVAFLLVYSLDVEVVQNAKGVEIPQSTAEVQPRQSVVVMITRDQLLVQGRLVASMEEIIGSQTPLIEPLRAVLSRPMVAGAVAATDATLASREITVLADRSLPYEIVRRVMMTCSAADYGQISLAVLQKEAPVESGSLNPI